MGIFRQRKAYFNSTMLRNGEKESAFKNYRILSLFDSQFDIQYDIQHESYDCDESKLMTNDFQIHSLIFGYESVVFQNEKFYLLKMLNCQKDIMM